MKKRLKGPGADSILALLLFAVFAVCILSVLLTGADSFRKLSARDQAGFDRRTAAQYIATRIHQSDKSDCIALEMFDGIPALVCRETYDGEVYCTRVYFHEGFICELFSAAEAVLSPGDGERIMPVAGLTFEENGGLITARITDMTGAQSAVTLAVRSEKGGEA